MDVLVCVLIDVHINLHFKTERQLLHEVSDLLDVFGLFCLDLGQDLEVQISWQTVVLVDSVQNVLLFDFGSTC